MACAQRTFSGISAISGVLRFDCRTEPRARLRTLDRRDFSAGIHRSAPALIATLPPPVGADERGAAAAYAACTLGAGPVVAASFGRLKTRCRLFQARDGARFDSPAYFPPPPPSPSCAFTLHHTAYARFYAASAASPASLPLLRLELLPATTTPHRWARADELRAIGAGTTRGYQRPSCQRWCYRRLVSAHIIATSAMPLATRLPPRPISPRAAERCAQD